MDPTSRGVVIALGSIVAVCGTVMLWVTAPMDFIERYLGFSPDNGDGSMEFIFITVFLMIITAGAFRWAFAPLGSAGSGSKAQTLKNQPQKN